MDYVTQVNVASDNIYQHLGERYVIDRTMMFYDDSNFAAKGSTSLGSKESKSLILFSLKAFSIISTVFKSCIAQCDFFNQ